MVIVKPVRALLRQGDTDIRITKYNIWITRADSAYITLKILDKAGQEVEPTANDTVRCQVRTAPTTGTLLFEGLPQKVGDKIIWHIQPQDTENLEIGSYFWDAQLELSNGDVFTFIHVSEFNVVDEVTIPVIDETPEENEGGGE